MKISRSTMRWLWTWAFVANVVFFVLLEGYAMSQPDGLTLSHYLWEADQAWPLLRVVYGMGVGGLAVHLWWHWVPQGGSIDRG